ncbi:hypothetical protein CF161_31060 [Pseudomonas sp. CF161]|nr:hypothetical protein CF161_31060 [Pseudomonas sp. CF161]
MALCGRMGDSIKPEIAWQCAAKAPQAGKYLGVFLWASGYKSAL